MGAPSRSVLALEFALLALLAPACAHQYNLPANRFETSETSGRPLKLRLNLVGVHTGAQMVVDPLTAGSSSDTAKLSAPALQVSTGGDVGILDRLDVGTRLQPNGPLMFRGKYQFYGEPEVRAAKGGFSAAGTIGSGFNVISESAGAGAARIDANALYYSFDVGLLGGYRLSSDFLLYAGALYALSAYSGQLGAPGAAATSFSGNTPHPAFLLGFRWTIEALFVNFEFARATASAGTDSKLGYYPGLAIGLSL